MYNFKIRVILSSFYPVSHNYSKKVSIKEFIVFFLSLKLYFNKSSNINITMDLPMYKSNKFKVLRAPYKNKNAWTPYGFRILSLPINITSNNVNSGHYIKALNDLKVIKNLVESFSAFKVYSSVCKSCVIFNFNSLVCSKEWTN